MRSKHGVLLLAIALGGCNRTQPVQPQGSATAPSPASQVVAAPADLVDISERDPRYLIGISFPPELKHYPALAAVVRRDAEAMRVGFLREVAANQAGAGSEPFELSLSYSMVAESPRIIAVAAEGTRFVGGAHGAPLLERYLWLLPENRRLTAAALVPDPAGWAPVSAYVRAQLLATQRQRFADDAQANAGDDGDDGAGDAPDDAGVHEQLENATDMVAQGTEPQAANFANFEPVLAADGRIAALRFVFPSYQVGPYSDGTQSVEVPASVLLPQLAPAERALFAGG